MTFDEFRCAVAVRFRAEGGRIDLVSETTIIDAAQCAFETDGEIETAVRMLRHLAGLLTSAVEEHSALANVH